MTRVPIPAPLGTPRMIFPCALAAFGVDIASKTWAVRLSHPLEAGPFSLAHVGNDALVLSLGSGALPTEAIALGRLLVFALCAFVATRGVRLRVRERLGFALIAAGGLGNLIDLVARGGSVVDFIGVDPLAILSGREGFHMFFNFADVFILVGLVLVFRVIRALGLRVQARFRAWEDRFLGRLRSG